MLGELFGPLGRCQGFWESTDPLVTGDGGAKPETIRVQIPADALNDNAYVVECASNSAKSAWQAIQAYYSQKFETKEQLDAWCEECCTPDHNDGELPELGDNMLFPAMAIGLVDHGLAIVHEWSTKETAFLDLTTGFIEDELSEEEEGEEPQ